MCSCYCQEEETKKQEDIVVKERLFNKTWAIYSAHKKQAAGMLKHADGLEFAGMVESENIQGLPVFEAKEDLVKSLEAVTTAAEELLAAMDSQVGVGKA